jgi:hypothetical protein
MLRAAARRLAGLLALSTAVAFVVAVVYGALAGTDVHRSIATGFYLVGAFLLLAGFFVGNRGPARLKTEDEAPTLFSPRVLRWATREEREDALNLSAVFVTLGFVLILVGIVADNRYRLW